MHGVSARLDDMTGFLPVYDRCSSTAILDSSIPVSVKAEESDLRQLLIIGIHQLVLQYVNYGPSVYILACLHSSRTPIAIHI